MNGIGRKTFCFLLLVVCLLCLTYTCALAELDSETITSMITSLQSKFPDGKHWNHLRTRDGDDGDSLKWNYDNSFGDSITDYACVSHKSVVGIGSYDCNAFDGAMQCYGFANRILYEIFHQYCNSELDRRNDISNIRTGDHIRFNTWDEMDEYGRYGHSAIVWKKEGNTLTLVECNFDYDLCVIKWGRQVDLYGSNIIGFYHATNWDEVNKRHISLGTFDGFLIAQDPWKHIVVNNNNNMNVELEPNSEARGTAQGCWHFAEQSDGSYVITSLYNGMALDVENADNLGAGTNVRLYNRNVNAATQHWYLMSDTSIAPQLNESIRLDVVGGVFDNGKSIQVFTSNGTAAQNIWPYKLSYDTTDVFPTNLTIDSTLSVPKGEKATIGYRFTPQNSHVPYLGITWSTSNSSIARVSSTGEVTGISPGTATITAVSKFNDRWVRTCTVTVESILEVPAINNISVNGCNVNLSWAASPLVDDNDVRTYEVKVCDSTGSNMVTYGDITDTSYEFSVASHGNYLVQITAINKTDGSRSKAASRSFIALDEEWMDFYWLPNYLPEGCEVQYVNHYSSKEQANSPGEGWTRGASHTIYTNGDIIYSPNRRTTSDTLVEIGTYYFHFCDGSGEVERFRTERFCNETTLDNNGQFDVVDEYTDSDPNYKVYRLRWNSGEWAGGLATCPYGSAEPLSLYYIGYRYQQRTAVTTYTWTRDDTVTTEQDPNADSVTYQVRKVVTYDNRLVIPTGTTRIEDGAFMNDTYIQEVIIPSECVYIGSKAFSGCTGLKRVYIPVGTKIEDDAFEGCDAEIIRTEE